MYIQPKATQNNCMKGFVKRNQFLLHRESLSTSNNMIYYVISV